MGELGPIRGVVGVIEGETRERDQVKGDQLKGRRLRGTAKGMRIRW